MIGTALDIKPLLRGYRGTDLMTHTPTLAPIECPFTGEQLTAVPAINPDVTIVHAQQADRAGNVVTPSFTVKIDKLAPTISGTATPAANGAGWNNSDVTVHFECADLGPSGLKSCTSDSILGEGARVEGAVLEGSIIGAGAVVRGRARTVNLGENSEVEW